MTFFLPEFMISDEMIGVWAENYRGTCGSVYAMKGETGFLRCLKYGRLVEYFGRCATRSATNFKYCID